MSDRISPPSWTEWTRNPNERTPARKAFDDIVGELRKEGLVEARSSLFLQLARYSYLQVKDARIDVKAFVAAVPLSIFNTVSPNFRRTEVEAVLKILVAAGLAEVEAEGPAGLDAVILTERRGAAAVTEGQEHQAALAHLRKTLSHWEPASLVGRPSSFPTPGGTARATGIDRAHLVEGPRVVVLHDVPADNENNPKPFLQSTIDAAGAQLLLLRFWPLPDAKGQASSGPDPEFQLLFPSDVPLASLVRDHCLPLFVEFFRSNDHHDAALEVQAKYSSYMHKYRERFQTAGSSAGDKIDRLLSSGDLEGDLFANAVYVVAQVLKGLPKETAAGAKVPGLTVVYQAARICYAHAMAIRVRRRRAEREAAARSQDAQALLARLRESPRPLTLEDLRRTPDAAKKMELGSKYPTLMDLLPLAPVREGERPLLYEVTGAFLHRENLLRTFLEGREREMIAQRERLARLWAREGLPPPGEVRIPDSEVSADFLKLLDVVQTERILAASLPEFQKDFVSGDGLHLERFLWPEGARAAKSPLEMLSKGLDPILYEDRDRLRRRDVSGVLDLVGSYDRIAKACWDLILVEEGLFRFLLRKLMSFFGGRPPAPRKKAAAKEGASEGRGAAPDPAKAARAADLAKLKSQAPLASDPEGLKAERDKVAGLWCLKLDPEVNRKTRQAVDREVGRLFRKIAVDQLTDENAQRVALFLVEHSPVLEDVTSSRAFHRYLYLTALAKRVEELSR